VLLDGFSGVEVGDVLEVEIGARSGPRAYLAAEATIWRQQTGTAAPTVIPRG
jgi:hypothetical protein